MVELQAELQAFKSQVQAWCDMKHTWLFNRSKSTIKIFTGLILFPSKICSFNSGEWGLGLLLTGSYSLSWRTVQKMLLHWLADIKSNENAGWSSTLAILRFLSLKGKCSKSNLFWQPPSTSLLGHFLNPLHPPQTLESCSHTHTQQDNYSQGGRELLFSFTDNFSI